MSKPGVRLDDDVYEYLFNHRTTKEKTISAVARNLINLKDYLEELANTFEKESKKDHSTEYEIGYNDAMKQAAKIIRRVQGSASIERQSTTPE